MKIPFKCDKVKITSHFGTRTLNGKKDNHPGYDMVGVGSYDICSVCPGKVTRSRIVTDKSNATWQWGNYVCVQGDDGRQYYYCHMKSRSVKVGDRVSEGTKLGVMGNTGYSFGAHLHFEVREGGKAICPDKLLGIENKTGTYSLPAISDYPSAIAHLAEKGVIASPEYWLKRENIDPWFSQLMIKVAKNI